jgi:hypothetical protein
MRDDIFMVFVKRLAYRILVCFFLGAAIAFPCFSKAATLPEWKGTFKTISINGANTGNNWRFPLFFFHENFSDGLSDFVKFGALIATDGKPISQQSANKEPSNSEKLRVLTEDVVDLVKDRNVRHVFLWFVFGVLCGYGFFAPSTYRRGRRKKPNASLSGLPLGKD